MNKKIVIALFLLTIISALFFFWKNDFFYKNQQSFVWINRQKIKVELSETEDKRQKGLSGREGLCDDCGMLFVFEKVDNYSFWMKEMHFNLDMVWISGKQVVKVVKNIPYEKGTGEIIDPKTLADKVLEIEAGKSDEWGIREGDEIKFDLTK